MSASAPVRRLHPASLIGRWLRIVPQMIGGGAAYAAVAEQWGRILFFLGVAGLVALAVAALAWWRFRYTVGDSEIVIESGLFLRQRRVIPYDRVQDIAVDRRLLARLFGAARVRIETGGSSTDEGELDMISLADAHRLRDRIRGTGDSQAAPEEDLLFALQPGRLLLAGIFNFSLLFIAAIFAVLQNLQQFGLFDPQDWISAERADAAAAQITIAFTLGLLLLLLALGVISGVARTVARDFGFRLTRGETGLRRRRGLFTLSEVVIPIHRVQAAVIESGPIARAFGWHALSFQTLGADRKEGGLQVAAPFARLDELLPILAEAGFPAPPPAPAFERSPRRALLRRAGLAAIATVAATAAALAIDFRAAFAAAALMLLAIVATLRWSRRSHALGESALFVSNGLFRRRLWIIPFGKAQTISRTQGPIQRRLGLASLLLDTAGARLLDNAEIVDLDGAKGARLANRLLALFHRSRADARAGFTLVELMVVIVIIGLAAAAVVLAVPETGGSARAEAERFAAHAKAAHDLAIVESRPVALAIDDKGFVVRRWSDGAWREAGRHRWTEGTRIGLAGAADGATRFDSTGLAEPIRVTVERGARRVSVEIEADGDVHVL